MPRFSRLAKRVDVSWSRTPDGDVRRSENSSQMCLHLMREDGIRLLEEIRHGLRRPAPDECRE